MEDPQKHLDRLKRSLTEYEKTGDEQLVGIFKHLISIHPLSQPTIVEGLSQFELDILNDIAVGKKISKEQDRKHVSNALTKLRRKGLIFNDGTRAQPEWRIVPEEDR
jgi:hypothetical protein